MHCGTDLTSKQTTREHIPSRCLLRKPYPAELVTIESCRSCNEGFSYDEEYLIGLLSTVLVGSTEPERQKTPEVARMLRRNATLRQRLQNSRYEMTTHRGETKIVFTPEMDRVKRVVVKNARGHALYELDQAMSFEADEFFAQPLSVLTREARDEFDAAGGGGGGGGGVKAWAELGTRLFQRQSIAACDPMLADMMEPWIIVQNGVYRYAVIDMGGDGLFVRSVIHEYLATSVYWNDDNT